MAKCERALSFEVGRPYFTYPSYAQTSFSITFIVFLQRDKLELNCSSTKPFSSDGTQKFGDFH